MRRGRECVRLRSAVCRGVRCSFLSVWRAYVSESISRHEQSVRFTLENKERMFRWISRKKELFCCILIVRISAFLIHDTGTTSPYLLILQAAPRSK